jgi:Flp pilus assembly protein TadG
MKLVDLRIQYKGQAIIEFALIFPLFMLVFITIVYSGLLFSDYLTLTNIARDSARQGAIAAAGTTADQIRALYKDDHLITQLYTWDSQNSADFAIDLNGNSGKDVIVTLTAKRDTSVLDLGNFFGVLPPSLSVKYTMYNEASGSS